MINFFAGIFFAFVLLFVVAQQNKYIPTVCKQNEILTAGKCVNNLNIKQCVPTKLEEDANAEVYTTNKDGKCIPFTCRNKYVLTNNKCEPLSNNESSVDIKEKVNKRLAAEAAKTGRVFIKLDSDFNLDTVITQFLKDERCNSSTEQCATDLADYCDNSPAGEKFGVDCDIIVGPVGSTCSSDVDCGSDMKCKQTPDKSKSYCA
jgi:hypothetical protein